MTGNRGYIPASELDGSEIGRIAWRVSLPSYAPADEIGVHIGRLGTLARLGGFESLGVSGYAGKTSSVSYPVSGVDMYGNAVAGLRASVAKVEAKPGSIDGFTDENTPYEYQWTRGNMMINTSEIDNEVGRKGNLKDPEAWSRSLNGELQRSVRSVVIKNLIERPRKKDKLSLPITIGGISLLNAAYGDTGAAFFIHDLEMIGGFSLVVEPITAKVLRGLPFRQKRISFFPGLQIDRVAAVETISRTLPLARSLR